MNELNIKHWLKNKNILITGGTGFLGKVLIEKLLWDCYDIDCIYILLRSAKRRRSTSAAATAKETITDKLETFKLNQIFDRIRKIDKQRLNKLHAINGDVSMSNLNLSNADAITLTENIHIIFNVAATTKFDEPYKNAIFTNVRGTRELIKLAHTMNNLEAFIHISTAFSNSNETYIQEVCYKPILDYRMVIEAAENNDRRMLNYIKLEAEKIFPNSYIFTKNLTEKLIHDSRYKIPVVIIRPPLITPAYKEPYPGWVDTITGPMGVLIGAGSGVIRSVYGDGKIIPDLLPVDYCVNAIIAAAVHRGKQHKDFEICQNQKIQHCQVYNCTTSSDIPISWQEFLEVAQEVYVKCPFDKVIWYPGGRMHSNYIMYILNFIFLQFIPAILLDGCLLIFGKKLQFLQLQRKIFAAIRLISYFLQKQWTWQNANFKLLYTNLSVSDKYVFNFNPMLIDYRDYLQNWIHGNRKFLLKCEDSTIPSAKQKLRILYYLNLMVKLLFYLCCSLVLYKFLTIFNAKYILTTSAFHYCNSCNNKFKLIY